MPINSLQKILRTIAPVGLMLASQQISLIVTMLICVLFNELRRLGQWKSENPLSKIRKFKIEELELAYLSLEDIMRLLSVLSGDVILIVKVCLSTGARWSEAESLKASQLRGGQIQFSKTKSDKNRSVPVSDDLEAELKAVKTKNFIDGLFKPSYEAFRIQFLLSELTLPKG